ncbi:MAG: hypothetical protein CMH54_08890 [Myxococcales bacterium]|nr:hypothetical protein [Myxococcales bacterium]
MLLRSKTPREVLLVSFLIALLLQIVLGWLFYKTTEGSEQPLRASTTQVSLIGPPLEEPKKKESVKPPTGQVVTLPAPEKEEAPPLMTRRLAKHDHRVEREQKARVRTPGPQTKSTSRVARRSKVQSPDSKTTEKTRLKKAAEKEKVATQKAELPEPEGSHRAGTEEVPTPRMVTAPVANKPWEENVVQTLSSTGGSDDALLDIDEEGDETLLNAKRYKYVHFFERIKERVRHHWNPRMAVLRRDPTGESFCCRDRYTVMRVVIDREGELVEVSVARPSGLGFLDKEGLRAFRLGAPFVNPPDVFFSDGKNTFEFTFGLLVEFNQNQPILRVVPRSPLERLN